MRGSLLLSFMLAFCVAHSATAAAQDSFPARNVRMTVAFGAGGTSDVLARLLAQKLGELWGQPVVIENRAGASGNLAATAVAQSAPDGHTLLLTTQSITVNVTLMPTQHVDPLREFEPVMLIAKAQTVLVVPPNSPIHTLQELIAYSKEHPDELTYGSAGNGTVGHLGIELLKKVTGLRITHVPYSFSTTQAYIDLMNGRVSLMLPALGGYVPQIQAGNFRALAVSGGRRSKALPNVPTIAEAGVPNYEAPSWYGLFVPKRTPAGIIAKLNADVRRTIALSEIQARCAEMGFELVGSSPEELEAIVRTEIPKWADILTEAARPAR